jgi:hypothetical protein
MKADEGAIACPAEAGPRRKNGREQGVQVGGGLGLKMFQRAHCWWAAQSSLEIGNAFWLHFSQSVPFGPCE